jgi:hypothetical protein
MPRHGGDSYHNPSWGADCEHSRGKLTANCR